MVVDVEVVVDFDGDGDVDLDAPHSILVSIATTASRSWRPRS
jgi:hypothetical protein